MKTFSAILLLAALICCGCSTTLVRSAPEDVRVGDEALLPTTSLVEALLDVKGTRIQAVSGSWKDHAFSAQCVLKGDGTTMKIVMLAPQMRLATLTLTRPHALEFERVPQIPRAFEPEYALVDVAFTMLETSVLRRAVAPVLQVDDDGTTRTIRAGSSVFAELTRKPDGSLFFRNLRWGYEYELRPISQ